jgi:hypothetical protein
MNLDASAIWRVLTSSFGTNYPMRLGIGAAFSCLLKTLVHVMAKVHPTEVIWLTLDEFGAIWYIAAITPLAFVTIVFGKKGAPEGVIYQINMVRALIAEGNFAPYQRILFWRSLTEKYLAALQPDISRNPSIRNLADETKEEFSIDPDASA